MCNEVDDIDENACEMINKLSQQLERSRALNDLFITFVDIEKLELSDDVKRLIRTKIQVCQDDKEN